MSIRVRSPFMNLSRQPDDPGSAICPCCRQPWPDEDGDLVRLVRNNIGRVSLATIAEAARTSLARVGAVARRVKPKARRA